MRAVSSWSITRFSVRQAACYLALFDWDFHETFVYKADAVTHCITEHDSALPQVLYHCFFYSDKNRQRTAHPLML